MAYLDASDPLGVPRGPGRAGIRAQNERLILTLVRRHGALAKAELARMSGLSAQTVSVIMRQLEADDLLVRGQPQRGRVGQPSVPLSLNPDGAFFLGAKIGRRSLDVVLVDFIGGIRHRVVETYPFPRPDRSLARVVEEARRCEERLGALGGRIAGLGVALPFEIWSWAEETGASEEDVAAWRDTDVRTALTDALPWPVYVRNDATAACGAELVFGRCGELQDFLYFFVGSFVGGGVVLGGGLVTGRTGNAGALGSMPVPGPGGGTEQLIDQASLVMLERSLRRAGGDPASLYREPADWSGLGAAPEDWLAGAARGLAHAVVAGAAILEFEAAVIDGSLPPPVRDRLVALVEGEIARLDTSGIHPPVVRAGSLGTVARALGGASLPLSDRYLVDPSGLGRAS